MGDATAMDAAMTKGEILIVDDAEETLQILSDMLGHTGYLTRTASSGEQALFETMANPPDLILLDIRMPGMDGFEVCKRLKENQETKRIPVIFISAMHATADQIHGFHAGAVDFLPKPLQLEVVEARVDAQIRLIHTRKALEAERARLEVRVRERTRELQSEVDVRRQAEERLHIYQRVFETTGDGMFITDTDAKLIEVNPAYCRIMGYSRNDVLGQRPGELRADLGEAGTPIWEALREAGHWAGEYWDKRTSGEEFPKWLEINVVRDRFSGDLSHYVGVFSDISTLRRTEEELKRVVSHDALTGLANRAMFQERLTQEVAVAKRHHQRLAVLAIDLDKFKQVNDSHGHAVGDHLLRAVAQILRQEVREGDLVARMGGDEFMLALRNVRSVQAAIQIANKLVQRLREPIVVAGQEIYSGGSVGISLYPNDAEGADTLIQHADSAMYAAKGAGRNQHQFYSPEVDQLAQRQLALETDLRLALERGQLAVHFQPQMELAGDGLVGAEALLRWKHPQYGMIAPDQFIPLAESSGLIVPIGYWVMREACRQLKIFSELAGYPLTMAINLSPRQFQEVGLADAVATIAAEEGVENGQIELEITESAAMADAEVAAEILHQLSARGFSIAIDDFGTGYSSLAYLRQFPVRKLKVDRSFIKDLPGKENDAAIATAIIQLAKSLGLQVVAEGVETDAQRLFLAARCCDLMQGYWYAKPMDAQAFEQFIGTAQLQRIVLGVA